MLHVLDMLQWYTVCGNPALARGDSKIQVLDALTTTLCKQIFPTELV